MSQRHYFICMLLLCFSHWARAQNYQLMPTSEAYYFEIEEQGEVIGLRIDSVDRDSLGHRRHYLNEGFLRERDGVFLGKMPSILGHEILYLDNGEVVLVKHDFGFGSDSLLLKTQGRKGEAWVDAWGHKGNVLDVRFTEVNGVLDSVKTLNVSTGFVLAISRNHGVYRIENALSHTSNPIRKAQRVQALTLSYRDVFDFEIGTVFHYQYPVFHPQAEYESAQLYRIDTLLSKEIGADGQQVYYTWSRHQMVHYEFYDSTTQEVERSIERTQHPYSEDPIFAYLPGEMGPRGSDLPWSIPIPINEYYLFREVSEGSCARVQAYYQYEEKGYDIRRGTYQAGWGMERRDWNQSMGDDPASTNESLPVYRLLPDGSSCGTPLTEFMPTKGLQKTQIEVFPNPFQNSLMVLGLPETVHSVKLYNALGQVVPIKPHIEHGELHLEHLEDLSKGWYYLQIEGDGELIWHQVLKQ